MAELVVGAVVTVLIEKLLAGDFMKFVQSQGIDSQLKKWNRTLPMIQAVLADAAQKQITQKLVELWMVELQDLVYDIEDVLDDIATEAIKRNLKESDGSTISSKARKMIPTCCTSYTPCNIMYGRKMSSKLDELTTRLQDLFELSVSLGLNKNGETSSRTKKRLEETSLLPHLSDPLGRQGDKKALLGKLLGGEGGASGNQNVTSIVSIVGMGGIGKTTLARLLYNDQEVKDHFELRAWVCISDDFDVFSISKQIYQALFGVDKTFTNLDLLHTDLAKELSEKRFLLVLDDVWNEDHEKWEALKKPLVGKPGSKVIVTTRNTTVASVMNSVQPHNLEVLSDETALSLFAQYALEEHNFDKHPSLSMIAQAIVEKCGGLPLALVTIGRVLKTMGNDKVEWEALLNSEIWSSEDESGILPALKLSYYHLPSHLKQLFAYCSLYPKDHLFDKNELILKWMAQGFLSQPRHKNQPLECLGRKYFQELLSRSFFQPSTVDKSRYTMHDLMNDLAISVAGKFYYMLDEKVDTNGQNEDFEKFRHFSFTGYTKMEELHTTRGLRTLLYVGHDTRLYDLGHYAFKLLTRFRFLRVLSLTDDSTIEIPKSIGNLKHLRFLNISKTRIREIPKQVGKLYNLQSLLVRDCHYLSSLPRSLVMLESILHLDIAGTPLMKNMPLVIARLTSLHALPGGVCIQRGNEFKISQLKGLSNLQGELSIKGLHNVTNPIEANDANLQGKIGLDDLDMEWSHAFDASRNATVEYEVLEKLSPPSKLKKLSISFYGGMKYPSWLGDPTSFDHLSELTLKGWENCTDLTLGHLSSLRKLCLSSMKVMQTMCFMLPSLESLEVDDMESLKIWSGSAGDDDQTPRSFPRLRVISIKRCPKLGKVSFRSMSALASLEVEDMESLEIWSIGVGEDDETPQPLSSHCVISFRRCPKLGKVSFGSMPSLESLLVEDMESLEIWSIGAGEDDETPQPLPSRCVISFRRCPKLGKVSFGSMPSLKDLIVEECPEAAFRGLAGVSSSICTLRLKKVTGLTQLDSEVLKHLGAVEDISINGCQELRYMSEACMFLGSLQKLEVMKCSKLKSINKSEKEGVNVGSGIMKGSLREVKLWGCDALESYCCPTSVERLEIDGCKSMISLSFSILLEDLPSSSSSSSSSLKFIKVKDCENIKSIAYEHLQGFTSLEELRIFNCPNMEYSFPSRGMLWPPNLKILSLGFLKKPMSKWGIQNYPPSLVQLLLCGGGAVDSFGIIREGHNDTISSSCFLLPPSLTYLEIWGFPEVKSLSEGAKGKWVCSMLKQSYHVCRSPTLTVVFEEENQKKPNCLL
uniref:putative disease resistance RPP13-like protein 1 n=1 Tax=Erigeron canadensis TaxID=72917 RepID=UPI001CB90A48|nr:putative disease resistance RPP13-like protein 1 [Erigeron canadensis]